MTFLFLPDEDQKAGCTRKDRFKFNKKIAIFFTLTKQKHFTKKSKTNGCYNTVTKSKTNKEGILQ